MKLLLTPERLAEIKERCAKATTACVAAEYRHQLEQAAANVPELLADIETLQEHIRELTAETFGWEENVIKLKERVQELEDAVRQYAELLGIPHEAREVLNKK